MDNMAEIETVDNIDNCDQLKIFKIDKSNREGDPHSLVYKIFRTKLSPDSLEVSHTQKDLDNILGKSNPSLSSDFLPEDKALLLEFDPVISPGDLVPEEFSREETPHSSPEKIEPCIVSVKSEEKHELRRSSRLASIQAKSSLSIVKKEVDESPISSPKRVKKKSKLCEQKRKLQKGFSAANIKRETEIPYDNSERPRLRDPRLMKLKRMVITDRARNLNSMGCSCCEISRNRIPKFSNVDPSTVLSAVNHHGNARKVSSKKLQIALFTTGNRSMIPSTSWMNENYYYCFKKMQRDIPYLKKKYQMLDSVTLDYYYEMSGYSLKKTEIILRDIIGGKEVIYPKLQHFPSSLQNFSPFESGRKVQYSNSAVQIFPHYESYPSRNLVGSSDRSSELFREILVAALKVLYCEEAVSPKKMMGNL